MFFISDPLLNVVNVAVFLYIFWRKRIGTAAKTFMLMENNLTFLTRNSLTAGYTSVKSSGALGGLQRDSDIKRNLRASKLFQSSTIFLAMSEGDVESSNNDSLNSADMQDELIVRQLEDDLFCSRPGKGETVVMSVPLSSKVHKDLKTESDKLDFPSSGDYGSLNAEALRFVVEKGDIKYSM